MKNLLVVLALLFVSALSSAAVIECKSHGKFEGRFRTFESDLQLACFNKYKSPDDVAAAQEAHPNAVIRDENDLDPHCYEGNQIIEDLDPGF